MNRRIRAKRLQADQGALLRDFVHESAEAWNAALHRAVLRQTTCPIFVAGSALGSWPAGYDRMVDLTRS